MSDEHDGEVEWYIELAESVPIPVYIVLVRSFGSASPRFLPDLKPAQLVQHYQCGILPKPGLMACRARAPSSSYCQS